MSTSITLTLDTTWHTLNAHLGLPLPSSSPGVSHLYGIEQEGMTPGLIATPEVALENVASAGLEFVILATDGLWDVVDDQVLEI